jgi:hypothetical protein
MPHPRSPRRMPQLTNCLLIRAANPRHDPWWRSKRCAEAGASGSLMTFHVSGVRGSKVGRLARINRATDAALSAPNAYWPDKPKYKSHDEQLPLSRPSHPSARRRAAADAGEDRERTDCGETGRALAGNPSRVSAQPTLAEPTTRCLDRAAYNASLIFSGDQRSVRLRPTGESARRSPPKERPRSRSQRSSSMRARIALKSSAARGRVTVPPIRLVSFRRPSIACELAAKASVVALIFRGKSRPAWARRRMHQPEIVAMPMAGASIPSATDYPTRLSGRANQRTDNRRPRSQEPRPSR